MNADISEESPSNYFWLTANPDYWDPEDAEKGDQIRYQAYNNNENKRRKFSAFEKAKPGDRVLIYTSSPRRKVTSEGKIVSGLETGDDGIVIEYERALDAVDWNDIKEDPILADSSPINLRARGSLFELSEDEYTAILSMAGAEDQATHDGTTEGDTEDDIDGSEEAIWKFLCDDKTFQLYFSYKVFGRPQKLDVSKGDRLVLYDFEDQLIYGPFTAESDVAEALIPEAAGEQYPYQVRISWDTLYRLPKEKFPLDITQDWFSSEQANEILRALHEEGTYVEVAEDGSVQAPDDTPERSGEGTDKTKPELLPEPDEAPITDILTLKNDQQPTPDTELLQEADEPGAVILQEATVGELRPELYQYGLAHLIAGRSLLLYGPTGTKKNSIARRLGQAICTDLLTVTATPDLNDQQLLATPSDNESVGPFIRAVNSCYASLDEHEHPVWMLIENFETVPIPQLGNVLTLLEIERRVDRRISVGDELLPVPMAFRVIATMDVVDAAGLPELYSTSRQFAPLHVSTHLNDDQPHNSDYPILRHLHHKQDYQRLRFSAEQAVLSKLTDLPTNIERDTHLSIPALAELFDAEAALDAALSSVSLPIETNYDFIDALSHYAWKLGEDNDVSLGRELLVDAIKFVVVYNWLFPKQSDWEVVDQAVAAYFNPTIFMRLNRVNEEQGVQQCMACRDSFATVAEILGFKATAAQIRSYRA
ncbi:EVE domain-containing protein [Haloplanus aerogenes]|uniref:EVE domain-containing protein n=1 Tax=Haloplanus aerogenes TaxID=660522 RepID=A0A3M0CF60_9EURY|nr:EVE domain-containing protein [Haloplanus aerogenes]AZH26013.1 EVE domain-containing protein [Haloplanus aerogenes]RMB08258.1 EVE domain-containing protein [Haloplanus aerogenes]